MICQSIVGNNTGKEKIITVELQANFIQPLLEFSVKELSFTVIKVSKETGSLVKFYSLHFSRKKFRLIFGAQKIFKNLRKKIISLLTIKP